MVSAFFVCAERVPVAAFLRALNGLELGDEAAIEVVRKTVEIMHG